MQIPWDKILAYLQTGPGMGILGLLAVGAYLLWVNRGLIKTRFVGSTTTPARREVLDYLDSCYNYFESVGCKEGMDLMRQAIAHAYHEHEPAHTTTDAITTAAEAIANALNPTTTS